METINRIQRFSLFQGFILLLILSGCGEAHAPIAELEAHDMDAFDQYWGNGETEIDHYTLAVESDSITNSQSVILSYKAESFSRKNLTELENADEGDHDLVKVLRLNRLEKERNGFDETNMMASIYTPLDRVDFPNSIKLTMSAQSLQGHSFVQLKLYNANYRVSSHSYLPSDDVDDYNLKQVFLEDELYTLIRINPALLPLEKFQILPSMFYLKSGGNSIAPLVAVGSIARGDSTAEYTLQYTQPNRKLSIVFDNKFPFLIRQVTIVNEHEGIRNRKTLTYHSTLKTSDLSKISMASSPDSLDLDPIQ